MTLVPPLVVIPPPRGRRGRFARAGQSDTRTRSVKFARRPLFIARPPVSCEPNISATEYRISCAYLSHSHLRVCVVASDGHGGGPHLVIQNGRSCAAWHSPYTLIIHRPSIKPTSTVSRAGQLCR